MKLNRVFSFFIIFIVFMTSVHISFADPAAPPPPPPVTSFTYVLTDEFKDCGPNDGVANFCDEYYVRQKVVSNNGQITVHPEVKVCGKDSRCTNGEPCYVNSVNDNNKWQTVELSDDWVCEDGYGLAQMHQPGNLNPNFDTLSFSGNSIVVGDISFRSDSVMDLYFNAYIPACVNRIPMINFNSYLKDENNNEFSDKVGLYARHETLDYDATPTGGFLPNFVIPQQNKFRVAYGLNSDLKTYRMWSFRERFVEGLQRMVDNHNLSIPGDIDVDSLYSNSDQDFGQIYFSRDFMMGAHMVENVNQFPVGDDIVQTFGVFCVFDVNDLNLGSINDAEDLENALQSGFQKNQVIDVLNQDSDLCNLDDDSTVADVEFIEPITTYEITSDNRVLFVEDIKDIRPQSYDNYLEFESWANNNKFRLSRELRDEGILSESPREEIAEIIDINYNLESITLILDVSDFDQDNATELYEYIDSLTDYSSFSEDLIENNYIEDMFLLKDIDNLEIEDENEIKLSGSYYTREVELNVDVETSQSYEIDASVEIEIEYSTSTESTWNWRSLESLTLNQLSRCLYNWDECLLNKRDESGVSWEMSEVADLGYGPVKDSVVYFWSKQTMEEDYDLNYGYHFDGARGLNSLVIPITIYKRCDPGQRWISEEGYYACAEEHIYKCEYGLSADEIQLGNVREAYYGDTIDLDGEGYVCFNDADLGPQWKIVDCNIN
ncbi:MAG: hypothetical protein ACOC16_04050 [Nanoarchaeota archaeon]